MKSLIKLKVRHTVTTGKQVPWDLIYLIDASERDLVGRLFQYHMIVESDAVIKELLQTVEFERIDMIGQDRDSIGSTKTVSGSKDIKSLINLDGLMLVVPLLSRGRKQSTRMLRYFTSKHYRAHLKEVSRSKKCIPKVTLVAGDKFQSNPCIQCPRIHAKMLDSKSCNLGSALCIRSIIVGSGSDFSAKLEGAV